MFKEGEESEVGAGKAEEGSDRGEEGEAVDDKEEEFHVGQSIDLGWIYKSEYGDFCRGTHSAPKEVAATPMDRSAFRCRIKASGRGMHIPTQGSTDASDSPKYVLLTPLFQSVSRVPLTSRSSPIPPSLSPPSVATSMDVT
jgi:hypothetical protein